MKKHHLLAIILGFIVFGLVGCQDQPGSETPAMTPAAELTATIEPTPSQEPTAVPAYEPVFETAECRFDHPREEEIRCGYLVVPEDRTNPEKTIRLHVAIVPSLSDSPAPDPVVYLNGGPGGYTLEFAAGLTAGFREVLKERDVILYDQRGIGFSEPSLNCPEIEEARQIVLLEGLDGEAAKTTSLSAAAACRERLMAEGINLSAYTSAASAADLDDLRRTLGYESWNLYGASYGTRLALTTMREFGQSGTIRSVVLEAVYPPQVNILVDWGFNADRTFNLIFERCAAIESCNSDYPNLKDRFYALVDALNKEPMMVSLRDRDSGKLVQAPLDGVDLINIAFDMVYNSNMIIKFPKMVRQLENGYSSILVDYLPLKYYESLYMSEGMQLSVTCFEEVPFIKEAEILASAENLPLQLGHIVETEVVDFLALCEVWGVETAEPLENEPVVSDIPTLILVGDYDPITPPYYGADAAEWLSNSFYFEFEGLSHGVAFSHWCGMAMMVAFLDQPQISPDAGCMERLYFGFVP